MKSLQIDILQAQLEALEDSRQTYRFFYAEAGPIGAPVLLVGPRIDATTLVKAMQQAKKAVFQSGKVKALPGGEGLVFRVKSLTAARFAEDLFGALAELLPILTESAFFIDGQTPMGPGADRLKKRRRAA